MKTKSFTLIELLVVIVIIGILSGVIVISVTNYINDAKNTKIVAELSNLSKSFEGNSNYYVGSLCIEDSASNSAFKTYYGLTSVPVHPNYVSGSTSLTTNNCYLYFSDGTNYSIRTPSVGNKGYLIQESRHPQTKPIQKTCDTGWIPFGNRCVMQYEAKCSNAGVDATADNGYPWASCVTVSGTAVSTAAGEPIVMIDQAQAQAACEVVGAHLITNAERMALARDIEQVSSNWTGGSVGLGVLKRGNVGDALEGDYDGDNPEYGTGRNPLAKLTLSNGQEIWDLSGNINEWVDDKFFCGTTVCPSTLMPYGATSGSEWCEYNSGSTSGLDIISTFGKYSKCQLTSLGSYTSDNGIGRIYTDYNAAGGSPDIYTHAFFRGGYWANGSNSGVFLLNVSMSPSFLSNGGGFRCVK